jgi:quercetin dioxygenase-like cupin family protein
MRRLTRLLSLVAVMAFGIGAVGWSGPATHAQEATPAAEEGMGMEGLSFTLLGLAPGVALPATADLEVARSTFAPGAGFPFDASDPVGALVIVEAGTLTITVQEQAWTISRGAAMEQAMASGEMMPDMAGVLEEVPMGTEATLETGDVAFVPGSVTGEVRNTGQDEATALLILMAPGGIMGEPGPDATPTS